MTANMFEHFYLNKIQFDSIRFHLFQSNFEVYDDVTMRDAMRIGRPMRESIFNIHLIQNKTKFDIDMFI